MENKTLWQRIQESPNALENFGNKACIYPEPYQGKAEVVIWFYCPSSGCKVFAGVPKEFADEGYELWRDYNFEAWTQSVLFPFCADNTEWGGECGECEKCIQNIGYTCIESPFYEGSYYGIAEEREFVLKEVHNGK